MTIDKWANFKSHKYKDLILAIFKNSLKHRLFHQKQLEENYLNPYNSNQVIAWPISIKVRLILKHLHYVWYIKLKKRLQTIL